MAAIDNICQSILRSDAFQNRFRSAEIACGYHLLRSNGHSLSDDVVQKLLLQASVFAFSDDVKYKRFAQKISALLYDLSSSKRLLNFALQVIESRLGNFPVVGPGSNVFAESNLFSLVNSGSLSDASVDLDISSRLLQEEEIARYTIGDRQYHFNVFQSEILNALETKRLVSFSAPTSFGKSFIVRHHIARQFATGRIRACLVIVPTKSLIDDFFEDLLALKARLSLDFSVNTHTRAVESIEDDSIYILTQERLSYLIVNNPAAVASFDLVYCDEAHYIARGYRGFLLRRVLRRLSEIISDRNSERGPAQFVFTSPIIKNPQYYRERIFPNFSDDDCFHSEIIYSPVEKNVFLITKAQESYDVSLLHDSLNDEAFEERVERITEDTRFPGELTNSDANEVERDVHIVRDCELTDGTICYTTSPLMAHRYGIALARLLPEVDERFLDEIEDLGRYIRDHFDDSFDIVTLLRKGVGLHYGPMPVGLRRAIVSLFLKGAIKYIFCTPTLLEGVNLPARNIVLFSDRYGGAGGKEKHSALSFWNLLGRAGRVTYGLSGNVFCIQKRQGQYASLLESRDAVISDPEANVLERSTPRKHFETTLLASPDQRFEYVTAHSRDDIEYLLFELLTSTNPESLLHSLHSEEEKLTQLLNAIGETRRSLTIPFDLLLENPGIDPRLQESLYGALTDLDTDELRVFFIDIGNPLSMTGRKMYSMLRLTELHLRWPLSESQRLSNRLTQWLREMPISEFIQQRIQYIDRADHLERVKQALRIIRTLESEFSYRAPKYLKCFFDIASKVAGQRGVESHLILRERIDSFLFAVESGISSVVGRYLFESGVSRPIAIKVQSLVSDLITIPLVPEFFARADVLDRLRDGLSAVALKEVSQHLQIQV